MTLQVNFSRKRLKKPVSAQFHNQTGLFEGRGRKEEKVAEENDKKVSNITKSGLIGPGYLPRNSPKSGPFGPGFIPDMIIKEGGVKEKVSVLNLFFSNKRKEKRKEKNKID